MHRHSQQHTRPLISVGALCFCCDSDAEGRLRAEARGNQVLSQPGDVSVAQGRKEG